MQSGFTALDEEPCPVSEATLGAMYRSSPQGLAELIATIPAAVRGMLAIYCYRRAHLSSIGLAIAATCDENDLTRTGGNAGAMLYEKSRVLAQAAGPAMPRRKVTLASGPLRTLAPLDIDDYETDGDREPFPEQREADFQPEIALKQ